MKKEGKQQAAPANGKAAQFDDSDVSASDEEDSEGKPQLWPWLG